eukprot:TRINITY_DN6527_c0_g1_i1.p1 TRINITY_DN6527_c0_g1~~TRINITY_DN6527_c0_g1_i1.p1  ORF type:complete len:200 (-),score=32.72 TRINITY_DN6527_c0_g1_i1:99-698(-)
MGSAQVHPGTEKKKKSCCQRFADCLNTFLRPRSTAFYVVPGIPSILAFILGLTISMLFITNEKDYKKLCIDKSGDKLRTFIIGSVICCLILPIGYANLIFDAIKYIASLIGGFFFFLLYLIGTLIFHVLGIVWISDSKCREDTYYGTIAVTALIAFLAIWGILFVAIVVVFIMGCFAPEIIEEDEEDEESVVNYNNFER